ncbi:alpha/beta hydrolase [Kitasatospora sp. NPDC048365]|uniref:alpha/beta hydrolase n=1 Tax=Kitasatospora sp. NPDC048365 TaxID=3364050 RepID=UPI0037119903
MDVQTLYDADLNDLLGARYAYEALTSAFAAHVEEWQATVVSRLQNSQWTGETADRVHRDLQAFGVKLQAADDELRLVAGVLADAHESIALAQAKLVQVQDDARAAGITVKADGGMTWENDPNGDTRADTAKQNRAQELSARLHAALAEADHADQEISRRLRRFADNATSGMGLDAATAKADHDAAVNRTNVPDPKSTSPEQVKAWWNGLTPEEQHELIHNKPEQIGNLDGIPATARDEANRLTLTQRRGELQGELDRLGPEPVDKPVPGAMVYTESLEHKQWREKRDELNDKLKGMDAIQTRLDTGGRDGRPPAYLLGFDTNGKGHAIVAVNNPDTADNVVTYVPGTGARLGSIGGDIDRSDRMVTSTDRADPTSNKTTASITWVGYDAPQSIIPEAADDGYAKGAEDKLHNFEVGLRTTHEGEPARQTIIGHSYGSTTVGYAMRDKGLPVDAVMFVGSPGTGVDNAKDLGIDPSHVYAGRGDADAIDNAVSTNPLNWVRDGASELGSTISNGFSGPLGYTSEEDNHLAFGRDPSNGNFGGHKIPTDPGVGHSDYWNNGGKSLDAMGLVISGKWS